LTSIDSELCEEHAEGDMTVFSADVLASMPSLVTLKLSAGDGLGLSARAFNSITAALRNGALQALQTLKFELCMLGGDDIIDFTSALETSGCAQQLMSLGFRRCQFDTERLQALMKPLGRGVFPALRELNLYRNAGITDVGVEALSDALLGASHTYLWSLDLRNVGMGDAGMKDLAFLVHQGRLAQLRKLLIAGNYDVIDRGIHALAGAINDYGLSALKVFSREQRPRASGPL